MVWPPVACQWDGGAEDRHEAERIWNFVHEDDEMNHWMKYGICFLFLLVSMSAIAEPPTLIWCGGCTAAQMKDLALTQNYSVEVYVADVDSGAIKAWDILQAWTETNPATPYKRAQPIGLAQPQVDKINALIDYYHTGQPGWGKAGTYQYPVTSINAYSVVNSGPNQNNLTNWIGSQYGVVPVELIDRVAQLFSYFKLADPNTAPKTTYTITFSDGSKIVVSADYSSTITGYKVVPNSGQDSHGNPILSTPSQAPAEFNFGGPGNPNDYASWMLQMRLLGYDVPVGGGSYWACTNSPAGLHCIHIY